LRTRSTGPQRSKKWHSAHDPGTLEYAAATVDDPAHLDVKARHAYALVGLSLSQVTVTRDDGMIQRGIADVTVHFTAGRIGLEIRPEKPDGFPIRPTRFERSLPRSIFAQAPRWFAAP
jgi:hypothetical protein